MNSADLDPDNNSLSEGKTNSPERGGSCHILVVDDEVELCKIACAFLKTLGCKTEVAHSADEALLLFEKIRFDVLFTDVIMPGSMNGLALAEELLKRDPKLRVIVTSGYAAALGENKPLPGPLVNKPYRRDDLKLALKRILP